MHAGRSATSTKPSRLPPATRSPTTIAATPTRAWVSSTGRYRTTIRRSLSPSLDMAYSNRGNAYSNKGELEHAIQDYDQAIRLNPKDVMSYDNRGLAHTRKGDLDRAILDFDQAIVLRPG